MLKEHTEKLENDVLSVYVCSVCQRAETIREEQVEKVFLPILAYCSQCKNTTWHDHTSRGLVCWGCKKTIAI